MAVPQIPMRWMCFRDSGFGIRDSRGPLLNGRLLHDEGWARCRDHANADAERKRPTRSGGVAGWKAGDDGAFALGREAADHVERAAPSVGFVARAHLAEDQRSPPAENTGQLKLRQ